MLLIEKIKKNIIFFTFDNKHVGCGFVIVVNGCLYCITAGHVVFGKNYSSKSFDLELNNIDGIPLSEHELISDSAFAKKYDLAIYKVWHDLACFNDVLLAESIENRKLSSLAYVKATALPQPFEIDGIRISEKLGGNEFKYKINSGLPFNDFRAELHGSELVQGISGSPLLLDTDNNEIVFHGVICKVPNNGVNSMPCIRGLNPIIEYIENISLIDKNKYDTDFKLINYNKALLEKENFDNWVECWRNEASNEEFYGNLTRKLKVMHGEHYQDYLSIELQKIMVGDECIRNDIEPNSALYDSYMEVSQTAARECMHEYVSTKKEALSFYKDVSREHLMVVSEDLEEFGLKRTDKRKLAQYDVATWLAVCHLRFSKNDN